MQQQDLVSFSHQWQWKATNVSGLGAKNAQRAKYLLERMCKGY